MQRSMLVAFELYGHEHWIAPVPAPRTRSWMDAIPGKVGYKCLPLVMANHSGWIIQCPTTLTLTWDGTESVSGLQVEAEDPSFVAPNSPMGHRWISSHFGSGILTFSLPWYFRTTQQGIGLRVEGMPNCWLPGMYPLTGLVETWGPPSPFTMNWKLLVPNTQLIVPKGFPICFLSLYDFGLHESHDALIGPQTLMSDDHLLELNQWTAMRAQKVFGVQPDQEAIEHQDLAYVRNVDPSGQKSDAAHWTKASVPSFIPVVPADE